MTLFYIAVVVVWTRFYSPIAILRNNIIDIISFLSAPPVSPQPASLAMCTSGCRRGRTRLPKLLNNVNGTDAFALNAACRGWRRFGGMSCRGGFRTTWFGVGCGRVDGQAVARAAVVHGCVVRSALDFIRFLAGSHRASVGHM